VKQDRAASRIAGLQSFSGQLRRRHSQQLLLQRLSSNGMVQTEDKGQGKQCRTMTGNHGSSGAALAVI
jgi:hypothetical protein